MIRPLKPAVPIDLSNRELAEINEANKNAWEMLESSPEQSYLVAKNAYTASVRLHYEIGQAEGLRTISYYNFNKSSLSIALQQAEEAFHLFKNNNDEYGMAACLKSAGRCYLRLGNYDKALARFSAAFPIYSRLEDKEGVISSLNNIGILYKLQNRYDLAIDYYEKCQEILKTFPDKYNEAKVNLNIGNVYYELGEYKDALEYHIKAHELFVQCENKAGEAEAYNNLGNALMKQLEFDGAEEMFKKGMEIVRIVGNRISEANLLNNLSILERKKGNEEKAYTLLQESLALRIEAGDKIGIALVLSNIATSELEFKKYKKALRHIKKSIQIYRELKNDQGECSAIIIKGKILACLHKYKSARKNAKEALLIANELHAKLQVSKAYEILSFINELKEDYRKSLLFYKLFQKTEREIISENTAKEIKHLVLKHQLDQTRKESEMFKSKNHEIIMMLEELKNKRSDDAQNKSDVQSETLNIVTHDLKNHLQSIIGFSEIMGSEKATDEEIIKFSNQIKSSGEQMMSLIKDFLQSQKLEAGTIHINKADFDLVYLIKKVIVRFNFQLTRKSQKIVFENQSVCMIHADEFLITSVIENLLSNSLKFSPPGKSIWLDVSKLKGKFFISIKDEGPGFSEEDILHAFKKFKPLSARPTAGEGSTGLGLYIVKRIIEVHHGNIEIISEGRNKGAEFIITLPEA